jgi:hypothetical protein
MKARGRIEFVSGKQSMPIQAAIIRRRADDCTHFL